MPKNATLEWRKKLKPRHKVQIAEIAGGVKALLESSNLESFSNSRVVEDAKAANALLAHLRTLTPYDNSDISDIWDDASELSLLLGHYGLDVSISLSIDIVPATEDDIWATEQWYRVFEEDSRTNRIRKRASNSAARQS